MNSLEEKTTVKNVALGSEEGEAEIVLSRHHNLAQIVVGSGKETIKHNRMGQRVAIETLDSFLKNSYLKDIISRSNAILLKMDVEGYEQEIVKGAKAFIEQKKPVIFLEVHILSLGERKSRELLLYLQSRGYRIKKCYIEPPSVWYSANKKQRALIEKLYKRVYGYEFGELSLKIKDILNNKDIMLGKIYSALNLMLINEEDA